MIGPLQLCKILHVPRWLDVDSYKAEASKKEAYAIYPSKFSQKNPQVAIKTRVIYSSNQARFKDSSLFFFSGLLLKVSWILQF